MSDENERDIRIVPSEDPEKTAVESIPRAGVLSQPDELPFGCSKCDSRFKSEPALRMHFIRKHTKGWSTAGNFANKGRKKKFPSNTTAYKRKKYREQVERFHAQGLNAHGEPFKGTKMSEVMRKSWAKRRKARPPSVMNGVVEAITPEQDNMGDSARAIIMAAQVLRAVSLGIKL